MILKKITEENVKELTGKKIYFIAYYADYIREFYERYPELPMISGIYDRDAAKRGEKSFQGHSFCVEELEKIQELTEESALVITTGYFREEYAEICKLNLPNAIGTTIYYFANLDTEFYEYYNAVHQDEPLENMIVFRSGMGTWEYVPGMDFTENARALFEYMIKKKYNNTYEMVWLVKEPERYEKITNQYNNVRFISYDWATADEKEKRDIYYKVICLAKYFFFTHACGFCRLPRNGQIRIQLWHGCGFKTVKNTISQRHRYEYMTVISEFYAKLHKKEFGLDYKQLLVTGCAKEDWLYHPADGWKKWLNIPTARKLILWLPTFREARTVVEYMNANRKYTQTGLPVVDDKQKLENINMELKKNDAILIIKLHPLQVKNRFFTEQYSNIVMLGNESFAEVGLHVNQIMGDVDALISDYSSAAIDFLLLDKPLAFTLDDVQEYEKSRGFILNPIANWIPGEKLYSFEDFLNFIISVINGIDEWKESRKCFVDKFHAFHDDKNCQRILQSLGI